MFKRFAVMLAAALAPTLASAQQFPAKPVRIIVPVPPGGVIDNSMRSVSERLAARLGQQVVIENRPGANGAIGAQIVAQSAPDGYTLLAAVDGTMVVSLNPSLSPAAPVQTLRDLVPVTKLGDFALLLAANPSVPAKNLAEFMAYAKGKPDASFAFGTSGIGSTPHLAGELLGQRTGIRLVHVPYKGGGQALTDAIGGQIPLLFSTVATAQQHVESGKLVALGVPAARRAATLPDTPTFIESGVPAFDVTGWVGIFAPAKTPQPAIQRLHDDFAAALNEAGVRARFEVLGMDPGGNTPEQFAAQIRADLARWAEVVQKGKIKLE